MAGHSVEKHPSCVFHRSYKLSFQSVAFQTRFGPKGRAQANFTVGLAVGVAACEVGHRVWRQLTREQLDDDQQLIIKEDRDPSNSLPSFDVLSVRQRVWHTMIDNSAAS